MKLSKWNINDLKSKFPNIIEKFLGHKIADDEGNREDMQVLPSVNISEADKAFEVQVAVPGLDKNDVNIELQDDCLVVSSEKQYEKEEKDKNWLRKEYGYSSFRRMFQLPESADHNKVQADMKNGVLTIKVAKKAGYVDSKRQIIIN